MSTIDIITNLTIAIPSGLAVLYIWEYRKLIEPKVKKTMSLALKVLSVLVLIFSPIASLVYVVINSKSIDKLFIVRIAFQVGAFFFNIILLIIINFHKLYNERHKVTKDLSYELNKLTQERITALNDHLKNIVNYLVKHKKEKRNQK